MGQIFTFYNHSREEFFTPTDSAKALETVTTPYNATLLLYLLTDLPAEIDPAGKSGMWIGDNIRIQGDYHPDEIKEKTKSRVKIEFEGREIETTSTPKGPVDVEKTSFNRGDIIKSHSTTVEGQPNFVPFDDDIVHFKSEDLTEGDTCLINFTYINSVDERSNRLVTYRSEKPAEWDNIKPEIKDEVNQVIQDPTWLSTQSDMVVHRPDQMVANDENGDPQLITSPQTIKPPRPEKTTTSEHVDENTTEYIIINKTKNEYVARGNADFVSAVTNPVTNRLIQYLLFNSVQDGSRFSSLHNPNTPEFEDEISTFKQEERERWLNKGRSSSYRKKDGGWRKAKIVRAIAANHMISDDYMYAGRWYGDNIEMVKTRDDIVADIIENDDWYDITDRLLEAFKMFVTAKWVKKYRNKTATPNRTSDSSTTQVKLNTL